MVIFIEDATNTIEDYEVSSEQESSIQKLNFPKYRKNTSGRECGSKQLFPLTSTETVKEPAGVR